MKWAWVGVAAIVLISVAGLFFVFSNSTAQATLSQKVFAGNTAEVYYSLSCGCCGNYIGYLRDSGIPIKPVQVQSTDQINNELNIPSNLRTCHTTKIGNYFVEGHIPAEAIKKLLEEKPNIDGIALPGMPSGSPGMPGYKSQPFEIYAVSKGQLQGVFMRL